MANLGGVDLGGLLNAVKQGTSDLLGGFRPDTANPALAGLGAGGDRPDLWAGLAYGQNPALAGLGGGGGGNPALAGLGGGWNGGYGGSGDTLGASVAGNPLWQGFADANYRWQQGQAQEEARNAAARQTSGTGKGGGAASASGLGTARWADLINEEAARYGDAPDLAEVAQAVAELESSGEANAQGVVVTSGPYAGQRAQGLMQIMPGNYPGANLLDPRTNVQKGLEMLYSRYKQYGDWDKAVAAYFGAIDGAGNITGAQDDNGTGGYSYVATVNQHRATIRGARQQAPSGDAGAAIQTAQRYRGLAYTNEGIRVTGNPADGFDCSSLVGYMFNLPRNLWNAQTLHDTQQQVSADQLQVGDLIYFAGTNPDDPSAKPVSHVGVYLGGGRMINAQTNGVQEANLSDPYWAAHVYGYGRVRATGGENTGIR